MIWKCNEHTPGVLQATVELLEPTGADTFAMLTLGPHRVNMRFSPKQAPRLGDTLRLSVDAGAVHLFDTASELRLPWGS